MKLGVVGSRVNGFTVVGHSVYPLHQLMLIYYPNHWCAPKKSLGGGVITFFLGESKNIWRGDLTHQGESAYMSFFLGGSINNVALTYDFAKICKTGVDKITIFCFSGGGDLQAPTSHALVPLKIKVPPEECVTPHWSKIMRGKI